MKRFLLLLFLAGVLYAQPQPPSVVPSADIIRVSADPTVCAPGAPFRYNVTNGTLWGGKSGTTTCTQIGGGGAGGSCAALGGDVTGTCAAVVVGKVNGVTYGASPASNTIPVVTGANTVTYEAVPNAALANSIVTVNGTSIALGASGTITAAPSGTAAGDLAGSYPNPTTAKINGTSVPVNSAADQILATTASATGAWASIADCQDSGGNHLNYNTTTHAFSCGTSSSATGANTALSNLAAVAINTALLANAAGALDLGSTALPWRNVYVGGAATNNNKIASAVTTGARTMTLPDADSNPVQPLTCAGGSAVSAISSAGALTCTAFGGGTITGSGTTNTVAKFTGATAIGNSLLTDDGTIVSSTAHFDIKTNSLVIERPNDATTGTTLNKLAKINSAGDAVVVTTSAGDQTAVIGCVKGGAGTTGSAQIAVAGQVTCLFDNTATTAGDYVVVSSATAATLNDAGSTYPASGMVLGRVLSTNAACGSPPCGPYSVLLMTPDVSAAGAGGGGKVANATAGDVAIYGGANKIVGVASDNLFFDTTNQRLGVNFGTAPPREFAVKYKTANNDSGTAAYTPLVVLDNPSATGSATTSLEFRANGTQKGLLVFDAGAPEMRLAVVSGGTINLGGSTDPRFDGSGNIKFGTTGDILSRSNIFYISGTANNATVSIGAIGSQSVAQLNVAANVFGADVLRLQRAGSNKDTISSYTGTTTGSKVFSVGSLTQPGAASPGTAETAAFTITGGGGGNCTGTGACVAGAGGDFVGTLGAGGANSTTTGANNATGGAGPSFKLTAGDGGGASATDTGTNTGGLGGSGIQATNGSGGLATNGSVNTNGLDGTSWVKAGARANADIFQILKNDASVLVSFGKDGLTGAPGYKSAGTKFTASGCSNSATVGGATAGTFTSGTTGTCTVTITMNGATGLTAPNGWDCHANDLTTPADIITQTASTTTTATVSGTTVSGDVISFSCIGY